MGVEVEMQIHHLSDARFSGLEPDEELMVWDEEAGLDLA